ncbi:hypothetical protein COB57_01655 [Candidatus Peregrinibacteria bacterium]|nr:MAG: hypothetical protein COB57_01655 [Candidatus Peregrinibacteria bacterium]
MSLAMNTAPEVSTDAELLSKREIAQAFTFLTQFKARRDDFVHEDIVALEDKIKPEDILEISQSVHEVSFEKVRHGFAVVDENDKVFVFGPTIEVERIYNDIYNEKHSDKNWKRNAPKNCVERQRMSFGEGIKKKTCNMSCLDPIKSISVGKKLTGWMKSVFGSKEKNEQGDTQLLKVGKDLRFISSESAGNILKDADMTTLPAVVIKGIKKIIISGKLKNSGLPGDILRES